MLRGMPQIMQPVTPPPAIDTFIARVGALAQQLGIAHMVLITKNPASDEVRVNASPGAMDLVKATVAEKFGFPFDDETVGETSWPGNDG